MSPPDYPSAWLPPGRARFRFTWQSHCTSPCFKALTKPGGYRGFVAYLYLYSRSPIERVFAVLAFYELAWHALFSPYVLPLSLIHISEPTRLGMISYAV